jgi:hypothetical protein
MPETVEWESPSSTAASSGGRLHREKFGRHYLFVEIDWDDDTVHGTAIPLRLLAEEPPTDDDALLAWLAEREAEHRDEIHAAWREVLGDLADQK